MTENYIIHYVFENGNEKANKKLDLIEFYFIT